MFSRNGRIFLFKARKTVVWMQIFSFLRLESLPEGHLVEVHWHCNLQRVWFEVRPKYGEGFSLLFGWETGFSSLARQIHHVLFSLEFRIKDNDPNHQLHQLSFVGNPSLASLM